MKRKNPVYETMTRSAFCGWHIRVWREEPEYKPGPDEEVLVAIEKYFVWGCDRKEAINKVGSLPRVAAIEILNPQGNGSLFYPDWK